MSKRIDKDKREEIRRRARAKSGQDTVRSLAKEFEVAPGTILKWSHREDLKDRPRNPNGPPGLSEFGKAVFREMVRLTGYSRSRLFEYLAPVWGELPCQAREKFEDDEPWQGIEPLTGKLCKKILHPQTFRREMKKYGLDRFMLEEPKYVGIIAVHKVQIRWIYVNGTFVDGDLLLLLERKSGALYAETFTREAGSGDIAQAFKRFKRMLGSDAYKICRVAPQGNNPIDINEAAKIFGDPSIVDDPPSTPQSARIQLPGTFANKHALNWLIKNAVNRINLTERDYYYVQNAKWEMTPYRRFARFFPLAGTEKQLKRRMRLRQKRK